MDKEVVVDEKIKINGTIIFEKFLDYCYDLTFNIDKIYTKSKTILKLKPTVDRENIEFNIIPQFYTVKQIYHIYDINSWKYIKSFVF